MKKWILSILMVFLFANCFSQKVKRHTISIGTAIAWLDEPRLAGFRRSVFNMPCLRYQFNVNRKLAASLTYSRWTPFGRWDRPKDIRYYVPDKEDEIMGSVSRRDKYFYVDLLGSYTLWMKNTSALSVALGPSLTGGDNSYVVDYYQNPMPPNDIYVESRVSSKMYLGISAEVSYRQLFWKNRVSVNPFLAGRWYPGLHSMQYNLGLRVGHFF